MKLGYGKPFSIALIVVGALLAALGVAQGDVLQIIPGVILLVLGTLFTINPVAVVEDGELQVKSPLGFTLKRYPVSGPADLRIEGKRVVHVATGKKPVSLGFGIDAVQAEEWRRWIGTPQG